MLARRLPARSRIALAGVWGRIRPAYAMGLPTRASSDHRDDRGDWAAVPGYVPYPPAMRPTLSVRDYVVGYSGLESGARARDEEVVLVGASSGLGPPTRGTCEPDRRAMPTFRQGEFGQSGMRARSCASWTWSRTGRGSRC